MKYSPQLQMALTSTSISMAGSMRAATSTIVVAGGWAANTSAWARPKADHCEMLVTYIRVRMTSAAPAPSSCRAEGDFQTPPGLFVAISRRVNPAALRDGGRARHADVVSCTNRPEVADLGLPLSATVDTPDSAQPSISLRRASPLSFHQSCIMFTSVPMQKWVTPISR